MKIIRLNYILLFIIPILMLASGCEEKSNEKYGTEEDLFPRSDYWTVMFTDVCEQDLIKHEKIDLSLPFYLHFVVDPNLYNVKKFKDENKTIAEYEENLGFYFFQIDSSLRCMYVRIYDNIAQEDGKIKRGSVRKRFVYEISTSDYNELLNQIQKSRIMGYKEFYEDEEFYGDEVFENVRNASFEIRFQGHLKDVTCRYLMPDEMRPLYDFIREELIYKYISQMNPTEEQNM